MGQLKNQLPCAPCADSEPMEEALAGACVHKAPRVPVEKLSMKRTVLSSSGTVVPAKAKIHARGSVQGLHGACSLGPFARSASRGSEQPFCQLDVSALLAKTILRYILEVSDTTAIFPIWDHHIGSSCGPQNNP